MCGIIGEISFQGQIDLRHFDELRDLMVHRGPDGYGTEVLNQGSIAFGHRRLSIIDLSNNAKQPMCNEDGTVWLTFNGEIYNFQSLKNQLISKHQFKSNSDTEVIIHGYEEWGLEKLLSKMKGMFAFGLYDSKINKVYIARDRFGIKPLVYTHNNAFFSFASELKCIAKHKLFQKEIDQDALADYFTYSYIPHPNTIWSDAKKMPPAHYGILDVKTGAFHIKEYWRLEVQDNNFTDHDAIQKSRALIEVAAKEHLIADVPIGLFLSGGYDSTTLLMKMSEFSYKPDVFTIAFPGSINNEVEQAKAIAKHFGVRHYIEEIPKNTDVFTICEELAPYYDEPYAGNSMINNHLVAKLASQYVKVAFSGEGADEVFGGYKWYPKIEAHYRQKILKRKLKEIRDGNFSSHKAFLDLYNRSMLGVLKENNQLGVLDDSIGQTMKLRGLWHFEKYYLELNDKVKSAQVIDAQTFVPNHCLARADMSSMINSLELRVPFLDHEIYEFVFSLNRNVYMKSGVKKFLLEEQIKNKVPNDILKMPKRGFSFQYSGANFDAKFNDMVMNGELVKRGILNKGRIELNQLSDHFKFHLLNLELWFKNHA
jgi:asparagine synthase (glutamine-hydrolysing)